MRDLSIVIVSFNTKRLLADCIASIKKYVKGLDYEVTVVDNGSADDSAAVIRNLKFKIENLKLIQNKDNLGFAVANNQGIKKATGRYILLLNSDTKLKEDSLTKMVNWMDDHPKVGIATCKLLNPDGSIQSTGGMFPTLPRIFLWSTFLDDIPLIAKVFGAYHSDSLTGRIPIKQDWVTGAFFMMRRQVVSRVGVLAQEFFMYVEDLEYCLRAKNQGFQAWYVPITEVIHIGSASSSRENSILGEFRGLKKFYQMHYPTWQYPLLEVLFKLAAFLRILVFGILRGQKQAWRIYGKAFAIG